MDALVNKAVLIITAALQVLILILLVRRKLQTRFFWFLLYILYELVASSLRLGVSGNRIRYWNIYWWTEVGDVLFMVLAFRESFLNVFQIYTRLRWFTAFVWGCIGAALLYATFKALIAPPVQANRRATIIISTEVAIQFALCVAAILFVILFSLLRIKGHNWEYGIISGFGIYVAFGICGFLIRSIFGLKFGLLNQWLSPVGYLLAETVWALDLNRPESPIPFPGREPDVDDLTKLDEYSKSLERFLRGKQ